MDGRREISSPDPVTPSRAFSIWLYAVVAGAAAIAAYLIIFTQFAPYDDEGTLLVTLKAFAQGDTLYSEIYSPYGPFYYELFGGFYALTGIDVSTNSSRLLVIVVWVATSLLYGLVTQRLTNSVVLGVAGMIAAFGAMYVLANEPMHPQVGTVLLLGAFTLLVVRSPRRVELAGVVGGVLLAGLALTKLNIGAYAIAAVVLAAVLAVEPLRRRPWLLWPVIAGFVAMPVVLMARDLNADWVRDFTAIEVLAATAILVAAWPASPPTGERDTVVPRWLWAAAIGLVVSGVAMLGFVVLLGSSPADIYDGMIRQALRVREVNMTRLPFPPAAVDWAIAALAGAALATGLRGRSSERPTVWPGLLRAVAGVAMWLSLAGVAPISLDPGSGNPDIVPLLLAWVAAIPPAGAVESPYRRFLRVLLPALAMGQTLQVYPVAGSQMGIAALAFVPVGALILADAWTSLRAWSEARGGVALERLGVIAAVAVVALAAELALDKVVRPAVNTVSVYNEKKSLPLAGAGLLHLTEDEVAEYVGVVDALRRYRCTSFIGYPNINSLYLWSGIEAPPPKASGAWIEALEGDGQQQAVDALRASLRPCVVRNDSRAALWLGAEPAPDRPLVRYINEFEPVAESGDFQILLPRDRLRAGSRPG